MIDEQGDEGATSQAAILSHARGSCAIFEGKGRALCPTGFIGRALGSFYSAAVFLISDHTRRAITTASMVSVTGFSDSDPGKSVASKDCCGMHQLGCGI